MRRGRSGCEAEHQSRTENDATQVRGLGLSLGVAPLCRRRPKTPSEPFLGKAFLVTGVLKGLYTLRTRR